MLLGGLAYIIARRVYDQKLRRDTKRGNTVFLGFLLLAGITGFATEFVSYSHSSFALLLVYATHLFIVASLLAFAPITKFVHAIGRPVLIIFERAGTKKMEQRKESDTASPR